MAEIRQELGIDVSQAVQAIDTLERKLDGFGANLDGLAGKLRNFNASARQAFNLGNVSSGLDKAAASTQKVVSGFAGFGNAARSASSATQRINAQLSSVTTQFRAATAASQQLGNSALTLRQRFQQFGASSAASVGAFSLSFQTLARIVSAQAIVRGINAIGQAFRESITDAIDFQTTISEIQTIAQGSFQDFDTTAETVRNLSDAFNASLGDVGEGLYQTISNQIRGTANQVEVLTQALVLSKVGVASVADSVSVLTGTLNAFELESTQAERVAAVLFKTVELGRTRISELANSFGSVATLANEAGASFEELAAAFATITINGVDTAKAATQIRGIFNAIIKPTEELSKVFEEAGFAEGAVAVQTLGLVETLNLISDAAGGSQERLAELIPRLRGITGQLILARGAGAQFQTQLDRINQAAIEGIQEEFEIRINTNAEATTRAVNQLSNALTVDLGQSILAVIASVLQFTTLTQGATRVVQILSPLLLTATAAFAAYAVAAGVAALANTTFASTGLRALTVLRGWPIALVAAGALAVGTFQATQSASAAAAQRIADEFARSNAERIKNERETRQALLAEATQDISDRTSQVTGFVTKVRVALNGRLKAWTDSSDRIKSNTKQLFDDILQANRDLVEGLKRGAEEAAQAQIDSQQRVTDLRRTLEDAAFDRRLEGRDPVAQAFLQQQRAAELARTAVEDLSTASAQADVSAAVGAAERALAAAQEAVQTAQTSGNRAAVTRALANQRSIINEIIAAEGKQQQIQKEREASLKAAAAQEEARLRTLEAEIDRVLKLQSEFDPSASPIQRDAIIDEVQAGLERIGQLSVPEGSKLSAEQLIDLAKFRSDIQAAFAVSEAQGVDINATLSGESLSTLSTQITDLASEAFEAGIRRAISAGFDAEAIGQFQDAGRTQGPVAALDSLVKALNAERDQLIQIEQNKTAILNASSNLRDAGDVVAQQLDRSNSALENTAQTLLTLPAALARAAEVAAGGGDRLGRGEATQQLSQLQQQLRSLPELSQFLSTEELEARLTEFNETFRSIRDNLGIDALLTLGPDIRRLNEAIKTADSAIQKSVQQGTSLQENLQKALEGIRETGQAAAENTGAAAANSSNMSNSLSNAEGSARQIATSAQTAARAFRQAADASNDIGSQQSQQVAFGGPIRFFNSGGFAPRGTDTVPAMLSPGEFVVNAKSSRKFFSQLQAINSGATPRFFQEGGPVTNNSFGDVNVTVGDSRSGDTTGREIARSLQRELRRKTTSLRR